HALVQFKSGGQVDVISRTDLVNFAGEIGPVDDGITDPDMVFKFADPLPVERYGSTSRVPREPCVRPVLRRNEVAIDTAAETAKVPCAVDERRVRGSLPPRLQRVG